MSLQRPRPSDRSRKGKKANLEPLWESEARAGPRMEGRAQILEAAAEAFMKRGFAATTLDHVATLLGTTKGQIYHYYRSKSDLYFDVVVGAFFMINDSTEKIEQRTDLSPTERLRRVAYAHALSIVNNYAFQRVALEATQHQLFDQFSGRQSRAMDRILRFRDEYETRLSNIIREGRDTGEFAAESVEMATKAALGSLNWMTVWYDPDRPQSAAAAERIAARIAAFVVAGLRPLPQGSGTASAI